MVTAAEMLRRLTRAKSKIDSDIEAILRILKRDIIDINREDNLFKKGIGTDGNILGVYSRATEEITQGVTGTGHPKRAGEPYNFYDTGSMFKSFDLGLQRGSFTIFNTSNSLKEFIDKTGIPENRIIGLPKDDQLRVNYKMIAPLLNDFFRRNIS